MMVQCYLEHLCLLKQNTEPHSLLGPGSTDGNPSSNHLWTTYPASFHLHIHLYRCMHTFIYPCVCTMRKTTSITAIFTLRLLPRSFLNDFPHNTEFGFSDKLCPVLSSKINPYASTTGQSCQWLQPVLNHHLYHPNHLLLPCPFQPLSSNEVNSGVIEMWGNGTVFQLEGTRLLQFYQLPAAEKTRVPAALSKPMFNSQESSSKYQLAHGLQIPATCT